MYLEIVTGKDLIADILPPPEYILESYLVVHQLAEAKERKISTIWRIRLKQLKTDFDNRHDYWVRAVSRRGK